MIANDLKINFEWSKMGKTLVCGLFFQSFDHNTEKIFFLYSKKTISIAVNPPVYELKLAGAFKRKPLRDFA